MTGPDRRAYRLLASVAVAAAVVASVATPPAGGAGGALVPHADKALHALGYAMVAFLLAAAWPARSWRALALVVVAAVALGGGLELVQSTLPARTADVADAAANAAGALAGAAGWWVAAIRRRAGG